MLRTKPALVIGIFFSMLLILFSTPLQAQTEESPNFSILGQLNMGQTSGFLGNGDPAPGGGLWLGIGLDNRWDGLWGLDYYTLPSQPVTEVLVPTMANDYTSFIPLQPSDDFSLSVNTRWYWADKYDERHQRFNTVPYFVGGIGMDFVVDQDESTLPPNSNFYSKSFDVLFSLNLGVGMDFPLFDAKQWFLYAEGMDHAIFWQGTTQILSGRVGFKVMLDSAHVDPFRGM